MLTAESLTSEWGFINENNNNSSEQKYSKMATLGRLVVSSEGWLAYEQKCFRVSPLLKNSQALGLLSAHIFFP